MSAWYGGFGDDSSIVDLDALNMSTDPMPIPTRLRPDLEWSPYEGRRSDLWIAHDPVRREFFFFSALEKAIAVCLDGKTSVQRIVSKARQIDDSVCERFVRNLIGRLDQASLLLNCKWRQTGLLERSNTARWLARASSWMAWRVPLLNPSRAMDTLAPVGKLLFGPTVLSLGLAAFVVCSFLLANRWSEFAADLAVVQSGLRGDRLLVAGLLLLMIKAAHELGHALACRSVGAECREMGLFFFFFAPCMYCDVSDTWRIPSRWKRMLVSAAGMITEMAITLIAFVFWYSSDLPWIREIAVQIMLLCSVVTVLVNANPLLRYDGYYILSDAIGIPNMADQARESWSRLLRSCMFGTDNVCLGIRELSLSIYHIAASIYRWLLLSVLIWGVNSWLLEKRLLGFGVILSTVFGMAIVANVALNARSTRSNTEPYQPIRWIRFSVWMAAIAMLCWMGGSWQTTQSLFARGVVEPNVQVAVYARHSGTVTKVVPDGSAVRGGDTLVVIESSELELQRIQAIGDLSVVVVRLRQAASRSIDDPLASRQLAELGESVTALKERVEKISDEASMLQIRSQVDGVFVDSLSEQPKADLAGRNIGQSMRLGTLAMDRPFTERGQVLANVVSAENWRLRVFVGELDVDQCKQGAIALVRLDQLPGSTLRGRVASISEDRLERTPSKLIGDTLFASTIANARDASKPEQTTYSVMIEFDVQDHKPIANGLASVQIEIGEKTVFRRWFEMLQRSWSL